MRCSPEQVAIVSGVQEALDLTARLLLDPGDKVCVENPGYPGALLAFKAFRARIHTVEIDDEGIAVHRLPLHGTRLIYVTPAHQFPLGTTMSLVVGCNSWNGRSSLTWIFEDDYDSEYRYSGRDFLALQGLDDRGLVLYAGSFSKVLFPALRLGYMVIPLHSLSRFEAVWSRNLRHAARSEAIRAHGFHHPGPLRTPPASNARGVCGAAFRSLGRGAR